MDFSDKKIEIAMFSLVAVLVGGLGFLLKAPVQEALGNGDVAYEMPRPKSFLATLFGLGLEDREIARKYVNPFDKKKKEDAKKVADGKKPASVPTVAQKKTEAKKAAEAAKKPKVEMKVVGKDSAPMSAGDISAGGGGGAIARALPPENANSGQNGKDNKDGTMSADQWRALVSGQPTKENVSKLLAAYQTKEVDDSTFYTIVSDLLRNNKSETQALGLYAVNSVYSAQSFAVVAAHYDQLSTENQTAAHNYLMGYATSSRSGVLLAALKSSNSVVVDLAAQVVIKGYQNAKSGVATVADPRTRGNVTVQSNSVADYSKFVPVFQQLAQSSDATIANLANSALSQMQTGVAAL